MSAFEFMSARGYETVPPSLDDLLSVILRAFPDGQILTTTTPIKFTTSDGAEVLVTVTKQPDRWEGITRRHDGEGMGTKGVWQ
jgi:hypothetical protein